MKRLAHLLLATLALCSGCSKSDILTPGKFTREFAESLRQARPGLKVAIVRDLELKVTSADGRESTSFLNNAYDTYKQDPKAIAAAVNLDDRVVYNNSFNLRFLHTTPEN